MGFSRWARRSRCRYTSVGVSPERESIRICAPCVAAPGVARNALYRFQTYEHIEMGHDARDFRAEALRLQSAQRHDAGVAARLIEPTANTTMLAMSSAQLGNANSAVQFIAFE